MNRIVLKITRSFTNVRFASTAAKRRKSRFRRTTKPDLFKVETFATAKEYDIAALAVAMEAHGLYKIVVLPDDVDGAVMFRNRYSPPPGNGEEVKDLFVFDSGSIVFWNVPEIEQKAILRVIGPSEIDSYDPLLTIEESESVNFTYAESPKLARGVIHLFSANREMDTSGGEQQQETSLPPIDDERSVLLQKYTFSDAMCKSVQLAIWEEILNDYIESVEHIATELKDGRGITLTQSEVLQKTGMLYGLRSQINLSLDLMSCPDFYWDRPVYERLFEQTMGYLNIGKRVHVLNERIDHCIALMELLSRQLSDKHSHTLEWYIIILIAFEVFIEVFNYYREYRREWKNKLDGL